MVFIKLLWTILSLRQGFPVHRNAYVRNTCKVFHYCRGVFIPGRLACVPQAKPIWASII